MDFDDLLKGGGASSESLDKKYSLGAGTYSAWKKDFEDRKAQSSQVSIRLGRQAKTLLENHAVPFSEGVLGWIVATPNDWLQGWSLVKRGWLVVTSQGRLGRLKGREGELLVNREEVTEFFLNSIGVYDTRKAPWEQKELLRPVSLGEDGRLYYISWGFEKEGMENVQPFDAFLNEGVINLIKTHELKGRHSK